MSWAETKINSVEIDGSDQTDHSKSSLNSDRLSLDSISREATTRRLLRVAAASGVMLLAGIGSNNAGSEPGAALALSAANQRVLSNENLAGPMPNFGYSTNQIWVEDRNQALAEARDVAKAGGNTIRILTPYTVGGAEIINDLTRYCNALYSTEKYGLRLEIGLDGHFRDGTIGYFPTQANEMNKLRTGVFNLMSHLAGGSCHDESGSPVKADEINLSFNEPNYKQRYKLEGMGKNLANLLLYLAPLLHQDAEQLNIRFSLTAADITLSEPNDPINFINEFNQQIKDSLKPGRPLPFDRFGLNYYAFGQFTADNLNTAAQATSIDRAVNELRTDFGKSLPIGISELGAFSSTPDNKANLYSKPVPATVKTFPGNRQGLFYENIIDLAACLNLDGVRIFHNSDDGDDVLRTGNFYPDDTPKPSAKIVARAIAKIRSGNNRC